MIISPDAAREAAHRAAEEYANEKIRPIAVIVDRGIDAFLSKTLEGADERVAEMQKRNLALRDHFPRNTLSTLHAWANELYDDHSYMLALVTALSAKLKEATDEILSEQWKRGELLQEVDALKSQLTAQKAAHAKMLREEAEECAAMEANTFFTKDDVARNMRRLADKIEGEQ